MWLRNMRLFRQKFQAFILASWLLQAALKNRKVKRKWRIWVRSGKGVVTKNFIVIMSLCFDVFTLQASYTDLMGMSATMQESCVYSLVLAWILEFFSFLAPDWNLVLYVGSTAKFVLKIRNIAYAYASKPKAWRFWCERFCVFLFNNISVYDGSIPSAWRFKTWKEVPWTTYP